MIWGNLPLMTAAAFLLFTNMAHATKVFNVVWRKTEIQRIIDEGDQVLRRAASGEGLKIVQRLVISEKSIQSINVLAVKRRNEWLQIINKFRV